jgi:type IV secretion system protein TrbG
MRKKISSKGFRFPRAVAIIGVGALLGACTKTLPPAVPDEQTLFEPPAPNFSQATPSTPLPEPPPAQVPVSPDPVITPSPDEMRLLIPLTRPRKPARPVAPAAVITSANTRSRVAPTHTGYADGLSSIQRYPYLPGKLYDIYSSPNHPTTILLPPGERLAAPPTLNPEAWDVGVAEMGEGAMRQEALIVRPLAAGQEATTPLLTQSGRAFFCRLRSFEQTSMVAVTWDIQRVSVPGLDPVPERLSTPTPPAPVSQEPRVDLSRLHTAYSIEKTKGNPPWVPLAVYDDGSRTFIRFKEALSYTTAPAVFGRYGDGTPGLVDFAPYSVPGHPEKGAFYIVNGLWSALEMQGEGGHIVTITRVTGQPKPFTVSR